MKHLSLTSRCMIEKYITFGYSFREIAAVIGCQPSTVSREVQKYCTFISPKSAICANYSECRKKSHCNERCADFVPVHCSKLDKAPFVYNRCSNQDFCKKEHAYYHTQKAEARSSAVRSESRRSIHMNEDEIKELNELVSPLIKK